MIFNLFTFEGFGQALLNHKIYIKIEKGLKSSVILVRAGN